MKDDTRSAGDPSPVGLPRLEGAIRDCHPSPPPNGGWIAVCRLEDIVPNTGVCALVGGRQVAVFRVDGDAVHAIDNHDPFSHANVLSRGIVGDLKGELIVASPIYKQHFNLSSGQCLEDPAVHVTVFPARVEDGTVWVKSVRKGQETRSTCCYCGVGCGVIIKSDGKRVTDVRGDPGHPANFGQLCTKGAALHLSMSEPARLLHPELRERRGDARGRVSWDRALDRAAERFADCIARHGPDSVAFYISGQLLTEDYYVFNKLAKGLIGTNNVDTNSRLCMSSAAAGYKLSLGVDAPPCSYEDIDCADLVLIAGSNTAFAHPVLYRRLEAARAARPSMKTIVVDPRRTATARAADLHLAIRPGTDIALFNAMLHVMRRDGFIDRRYIKAHTEGFAEYEAVLTTYTPACAARICDVGADQIVQAARWFGAARAALSLYCQGLNQSTSGTHKNSALINLHLATGQIGRPGAGPFSLTGQPNAMGGREVGGMANLLPAHRDLASAKDRAETARLWGVPSVPDKPGRTAVEMFDAIGRGEIRMVWIACTNPAQSLPDALAARRALSRAEFVVVQDAFRDTDTCQYADLLLPATGWAEKEGTVTNSERRISRVRAAVPAPGEARNDWEIAADFARRLEAKLAIPGRHGLFPYRGAEEVFNEHRATTAGRDLDITGLSYETLERDGPQQWPFPAGASVGKARLYSDGVYRTLTGRACFVAAAYTAPAEEPDGAYPLRLTTGRLRDQWHGMTRTGLVARLFSHSPEPEIAMHPDDLRARGLADGALARVSTRRGAVVMKARASEDMRRGDIFIPMHWGSRFMAGAGTNTLTLSAVDPHSKQPELKHAVAQVERYEGQWRCMMLRSVSGADESARLQLRAAQLLRGFDYGALSLAEGAGPALGVELAAAAAPSADVLAALDELFGLSGSDALTYRDARRGTERRARLEGGFLVSMRLTGELTGHERLQQALLQRTDVFALRRQLLAPVAEIVGLPQRRGRIVCSCYNVGEEEICAGIAAGQSMAQLQSALKCGTNCGSCVPELKQLLAAHARQSLAA
jgi:assimilatory nitrate reductase catalytic subunit